MLQYKYLWIIIFKTLINKLIKKGKKNIAFKIVTNFIIELNKETLPWKSLLCQSILKLKPLLKLTTLIKRYKKVLIPNIISFEKEIKIAISWLINSLQTYRNKNKFHILLKNEILAIIENKNSKSLEKKKQFNDLLVNQINLNARLNKNRITKRKKKW